MDFSFFINEAELKHSIFEKRWKIISTLWYECDETFSDEWEFAARAEGEWCNHTCQENVFRTSIVRNFMPRGVNMRISAREACVKPHLTEWYKSYLHLEKTRKQYANLICTFFSLFRRMPNTGTSPQNFQHIFLGPRFSENLLERGAHSTKVHA